MNEITALEKIGLLANHYVGRAVKTFRDLKLSNPKAWNPSLWNLYGKGESASGIDVNEETGLNTSAVFNAITIISGTMATLPIHLYKKKQDGSRKVISNHPVLPLLSTAPNPGMAAINYHEALQSHQLAWGNEYSEIVRNRMGTIVELWPITPDRVKPYWDNFKKFYDIKVGSETVTLPQEKVLHIAGLGYDGMIGYSVVRKAKEAIGLAMATEEFGGRFFGANTNMGGVIKYPRALGPDAKKNLKDSLNQNYTGLGKSHRWMILEQGVELDKIGIDPDDSQFLQTRQFQVQDIARWFNMPPHMLKDLSRATFSNIEEQSLEFIKYTMNPWIIRREQNYNKQLLTEKERQLGYYWKYSVEGLLRGDSKSRSQFYKELFYLGSMTPNEIRIKEDMEPIDGGDTAFVQVNMMRLEDAVKKPEPMIMPASTKGNEEPDQIDNEEKSFWNNILDHDRKAIRMIEDRSIVSRDRISRQYYRLLFDAAQRIINKETKSVQKAIKLNERGERNFKKWLKKFYDSMPDYIHKQLGPTLNAFNEAIIIQAANEINIDLDTIENIDEFKSGYLDAYIRRHIERSYYQIDALDEMEDINQRMDEWFEKRAEKIAVEESVRASSASAQVVFFAGGYAAFWRIRGAKTCPYCTELSGRSVKQGETLFEGGENWEPSGSSNGPMKIRNSISHPPLHQGCDCYVSYR